MSNLDIERLYHPDGHHLGSLIAGLSGSGKTTAVISTIQQAIKNKKFGPSHRFVIIDPKTQVGDYDLVSEPLHNIEDFEKSVRENRTTLFWPSLEFIEEEVSHIVEYLFQLSDENQETSFTLVLDEASILITPTRIPTSLKKLAIQGRAKRIKPVFLSQRPIVNRWTDSQMSSMCLFNVMPTDWDILSKRWGVKFEEHAELLRETPYSFIWFDMEKAKSHPMQPVDLPNLNFRPKKKGRWQRLLDL